MLRLHNNDTYFTVTAYLANVLPQSKYKRTLHLAILFVHIERVGLTVLNRLHAVLHLVKGHAVAAQLFH
ncbi:hypothetical protein D3C84_1004290 [compost metagenome]